MKNIKADILHFIELAYQTPSTMWSEYIYSQLKKNVSLELIEEICKKSDKKVSEAVLVFLSAIRYVSRNMEALNYLEESDRYPDFIEKNRDTILKVGISKRNQANFHERALPIIEIFSKKIDKSKSFVIELGASFGLIGYCMTHYDKILKKKNDYFAPDQQFPAQVKIPDSYIGLDINPPDKQWLLSCLINKKDRILINKVLTDIEINGSTQLIKSDVLHFPTVPSVLQLLNEGYSPVILTSFILYMLTAEKRKRLTDLINRFTFKHNGHWINQCVDLQNQTGQVQFFLQLDGKNVIRLQDDRCRCWEYI